MNVSPPIAQVKKSKPIIVIGQQPKQPEEQKSFTSKSKILNDYTIMNKYGLDINLGRGSYGQVKLVKDKRDAHLYAMKIINKNQLNDKASMDNLKREIKIQRKLDHPNLIKLHEYFEDKKAVYLIMEYAENNTLFSRLRSERTFSEEQAMKYFKKICIGIDYLHQAGIIHRDLKLENVLLTQNDDIKLCDFGLSVEDKDVGGRKTFCGTFEYMAPEMLNNEPHNQSIDIWALGILLYELLHGYSPFKGINILQVLNNQNWKIQITYDPHLSHNVRQLIDSLLKYKSCDRIKMNQILEHDCFKLQSIAELRDSSKTSSSVLTQKSQNLTKKYVVSSSVEKQRVSRLFDHENSEISKSNQSERQSSLIERLLQKIGCMSRDKG